MKTRSTLIIAALCLAGLTLAVAQNANMGTWKLNEAKSKLAPGMTKNPTVVYAAAGDSVKVTTDGTDGEGKPQHTEWIGKFDGKDYPLTGDPNADTRSYTQVDDHTLTLENKKGGQVVATAKIVVSADGKTRTVTVNGTDAKGSKMTSEAVYDKQ